MAEQAEYRYDAFISYSQADAGWVWDWLLPRLKAASLRVCIDRDCFEPGAVKLNEIERAITESRRTLTVLSPDWVEDEWNEFESQLIHHRDPAARFRRLIPLLLIEPDKPPEHIERLHWVDFTQPDQREAQLDRVVQAIQGTSTLPELRLDEFPSPKQRRLELRLMGVVGVITLLTLVLVAVFTLGQRGPTSMPEGGFNIAVAEFSAVDETGQPKTREDARELSSSVAGYLNTQADALQPVTRQKVTVWGPEQKVRPIASGEEGERADDLNADVLLYGTLRQQSEDIWLLEPAFYLTAKAVGQANELLGEHALGTPIAYRPDNLASQRDANAILQARLQALVQILLGLSDFSLGTQEGYQQAATDFEDAATGTEWGEAEDDTGQEILHLFLGSAYLLQTNFLQDDPDALSKALRESQAAYQKAIDLNSDYPRAYNGLGAVLFQLARPQSATAECEWEWNLLDQAADAYNQALAAPEETKPSQAYVDARAQLGLGRIHFIRGYCLVDDRSDAWDTARAHYDAVVAEYLANPNAEFLENNALVAYTELGHLAFFPVLDAIPIEGGSAPDQAALLDEAIQNYSHALELPDTQPERLHAMGVMSFLLDAYCLAGQTEEASTVLHDFVADLDDPSGARKRILEDLRTYGSCDQKSRIR